MPAPLRPLKHWLLPWKAGSNPYRVIHRAAPKCHPPLQVGLSRAKPNTILAPRSHAPAWDRSSWTLERPALDGGPSPGALQRRSTATRRTSTFDRTPGDVSLVADNQLLVMHLDCLQGFRSVHTAYLCFWSQDPPD